MITATTRPTPPLSTSGTMRAASSPTPRPPLRARHPPLHPPLHLLLLLPYRLQLQLPCARCSSRTCPPPTPFIPSCAALHAGAYLVDTRAVVRPSHVMPQVTLTSGR